MQPLAAPRRPFGSGSLLLAPLSNFRAGTLPTTVSLPHSHKPETDSLPACLAARSPSLSVAFCLSLPLCPVSLYISLLLFYLFIYLFFFACWVCPAVLFPLSLSGSLPFRITGLQSHSQHLNHAVPCRCLSSALSFGPYLHLHCTHCGPVTAPNSRATFFHFNYPSFTRHWDTFFCTYILLSWPNALATLDVTWLLMYSNPGQFIISEEVWVYFKGLREGQHIVGETRVCVLLGPVVSLIHRTKQPWSHWILEPY